MKGTFLAVALVAAAVRAHEPGAQAPSCDTAGSAVVCIEDSARTSVPGHYANTRVHAM